MSVGEVSFGKMSLGKMSFDRKSQNEEKHPNIKNIDLIFFLKEHSFEFPLFLPPPSDQYKEKCVSPRPDS